MRTGILQQYIERVSQEEHEEELNARTPEEVAADEVVVEAELDVPAPVEEVTEEQVEAAELEAEEAVEEQAAIDVEIDEADAVAEEAEEEQVSIEEFCQVLEHGIRTKTYSPQFAAIAQSKLNKLSGIFGEQSQVSLENYGGDTLGDYYQVSLESFRGFLKRVEDLRGRVGKFLPELLRSSKMVKGYQSRAAAANTKADALIKQAGELDQKAVYKGGAPKGLSGGGDNVLTAASNDLRLTSASVTKGLAANTKLVASVLSILNKAVTEGGDGKTGPIVAEAAKLQPTHGAYPQEAFSNGFLGGLKLGNATEVAGEGADTRTALKVLSKGAVPSVEKTKVEKIGDVELSKADIGKLLSMAKVFAQLGAKSAEQSGASALDQVNNLKATLGRAYGHMSPFHYAKGGANATTWSEGKDLDALATAFPKILNSHVAVYRAITDHALSVAEDLIDLAERAVKKAKAPEAAE